MAAYTSAATGNWSALATWVGIAKTGTITTNTASAAVVGVGTLFTTELAVGSIVMKTGGTVVIGTVLTITDDLHLTLTGNAASTNAGVAYAARVSVPGSADTLTIAQSHIITVDANETTGNNSATGGTAAITFGAGAASAGLVVNAGIVLTLSGDVRHQGLNGTVTVAAGGSVIFLPTSGAKLKINCGTVAGSTWTFNGTSGSHCTLKTDLSSGGSQTYFLMGGSSVDNGVLTATYLDVINMGDISLGQGINANVCSASNTAVSWDHITLNGSNFGWTLGSSTNWDGNLTITNMICTNSTATNSGGLAGCCAVITSKAAASSGTRTIQFCSFDTTIAGTTYLGFGITDSVLVLGYFFGTITHAANAIARCYLGVPALNTSLPIQNSATDCYVTTNQTANTHYMTTTASMPTGAALNNFVFEGIAGAVTKCDVIVTTNPTIASTTLAINNWIVLPNTGCIQFVSSSMVNMLLSVFHCTFHTDGFQNPSQSGVYLSENSTGTAGSLAAYKANLTWNASSNLGNVKLQSFATGTPATDFVSPSNADYNGGWNLNLSTPFTAAGNPATGFSNSGNGYATKQSSVPGTHDLADTNPLFVDSTRNLAAWGGTPTGGGVATNAGALAALQANPALVGQAGTGLLQWVRAGFAPHSSVYEAASYPGDTSTADANGGTWPGGSPGVGAMAWQPPPVFFQSITGQAVKRASFY